MGIIFGCAPAEEPKALWKKFLGAKGKKVETEAAAKDIFACYDANKDNVLSKEEFKALIKGWLGQDEKNLPADAAVDAEIATHMGESSMNLKADDKITPDAWMKAARKMNGVAA